MFFFFSSRRRHTRSLCDWSSDVCSSDLLTEDDREIRHRVKQVLDKLYEFPSAPKDGEPAPARLLEGKHLETFAKSVEALAWSRPGGLEKRYEKYNKDRSELNGQQDDFFGKMTDKLLDK